ncbi:MAG TPA: iron donor protein CyaY [Rhodocyclaceae bacterium]|nr:iron donor protein CyaY [Rhodocyclaceae bacterium]
MFLEMANAELARLEMAIETAMDAAGIDADIESQDGGILELTFDNDSKIIINRHIAAREIWVAARSGGFHFRFEDGRWLGTRDGEELHSALSRLIAQQSGVAVQLAS